MIEVPQSTVAKPLTVIDYIAVMEQCGSLTQLSAYASRCPGVIVEDERFVRAFKRRLEAIRSR